MIDNNLSSKKIIKCVFQKEDIKFKMVCNLNKSNWFSSNSYQFKSIQIYSNEYAINSRLSDAFLGVNGCDGGKEKKPKYMNILIKLFAKDRKERKLVI